MKKLFLILSVVLVVCISVPGVSAAMGRRGVGEYVPKVRMMEPRGDIVNLTGKEFFGFKWSPHEGNKYGRKYYDFRLYKGDQALGPYLIHKEQVSPRADSLSLDASMFTNGEVYTWTMRQVYRSIGKSDRSFSTFKVIKKVNGGV